MNVRRYRFIKLLLAFLIIVTAIYGVMQGGDPTLLISLGIAAAGGLAGLEITEILATYQDGKAAQASQQEGGPDQHS